MPTIAGLRGTGDFTADERPKNFRETILWLDPNGQAPLTALMARMSSQKTDDPEFSWWEESQDHQRARVDADVLAGDGTLSIDDGHAEVAGAKQFVKGDLLMFEDASGRGEVVRVTADPTTETSLTVARGYAGSTAAGYTAADGIFIVKIGSAFEEGSRAPKAVSRNPTKLFNYTQIFKTRYALTRTGTQTRYRTGNALQNDKKRRMFDHARSLEMATLFGRASETIGSDGEPERTTAGINNFINTHRFLFDNATPGEEFTEDGFIDRISPVFDWQGQGSGDERIAFLGNGALTAINKLARDSNSTRVNFDGVVKVYGMNLQRWIFPQGTIYLRTHPLMNIHPVYRNSMFLINPRGIMERALQPTKSKENIQENDKDSVEGMWLTEMGIELHHERTMGYFGNLVVPTT